MRIIIIFIVVTLVAKVVLGYFTSIESPYVSESVIVQLVQWGESIMVSDVVTKMELPI